MSAVLAYMHVKDFSDNWVPQRGDTAGGSAGSVGGVKLLPWTYVAAAGGITDTSDVTLIAAAGAGKSNYLTSLQLINKHATVATEVVVKSGSTVLWRGFAPAVGVGPVSVVFGTPLASAANTALTAACITTGTATLINAQGHQDVSPLGVTTLISDREEVFAGDGTLLLDGAGATIYLH
jgi:hypothetical protein